MAGAGWLVAADSCIKNINLINADIWSTCPRQFSTQPFGPPIPQLLTLPKKQNKNKNKQQQKQKQNKINKKKTTKQKKTTTKKPSIVRVNDLSLSKCFMFNLGIHLYIYEVCESEKTYIAVNPTTNDFDRDRTDLLPQHLTLIHVCICRIYIK